MVRGKPLGCPRPHRAGREANSLKHSWSRGEAWGKATAAIFGSTILYVGLSAFLGRMLPFERGLSIALALLISIPSWTGIMVAVILARSGARAWAYVSLSATALFAVTLWSRSGG